VTVSAIETKLADVELVAVRDGLNRSIAHVRVPRRKVVPDARDRERRTEAARDGGHDRELVPPGGKYLGQRLGLRGGGQLPTPRVHDGTVMAHRRAPINSSRGNGEILSIEVASYTNSEEGQARRTAPERDYVSERVAMNRLRLIALEGEARKRGLQVERRRLLVQPPQSTRRTVPFARCTLRLA
jgi:hypothetical protein